MLGPELDLFLQVSELGTSGHLAVVVREFTNGKDTTRVAEDATPHVVFAAWPAVTDCAARQLVAPIDRGIDGVSPRRISELVAAQAVPFTWADGTETTLVLSPRPSTETGCAFEEGGLIYWSFEAEVSVLTADGILNGSRSGSARLIRGPDHVMAAFEMSGSSSKEELAQLLSTPAAAANEHDGYVDFDVEQSFAWPSEQPVGSEGGISIVVAPPPACDTEKCDVRFTLADGRVPAAAAPPQ